MCRGLLEVICSMINEFPAFEENHTLKERNLGAGWMANHCRPHGDEEEFTISYLEELWKIV